MSEEEQKEVLKKPHMTKDGLVSAVNRRKWGPARFEVDLDKVYELACISMTQQQISDYFGISLKTFSHNQDYIDSYNEGKAVFTKSILEKQYKIAMDDKHKDQTKLLIHLGKVSLGQRETTIVENNLTTSFDDLLAIKTKIES